MAHWSSETGILRKNKPKENHEELLVFGYACKLFRDDEKAQYIDQGKHLIPWMADDKLKIDRYDCRGALSDLKRFEASREGYDAMRWLGLSESDRKLEELCDKERYYSLLINEEEEEMYKEEEMKRQKTNAFQYSYDVPSEPVKEDGIPTVPEEEEKEYVPLPALDVPVDINIPKTVKEYARIEKTAKFVCNQGPQMEILIKAKQGDNPQFSFLTQGDTLYKFYRHVLSAFKSGRYQGQEITKPEDKQESTDESDGHYLHPSLLSANAQPETKAGPTYSIPSLPYKPSANCAYSQLVNRIQGNQSEAASEAPKPEAPQNFAQMNCDQQQYYQYYYTAQYYEYYKQLAQYQQSCGDNPGQIMPPPDFQLEPSVQAYFQQIAYTQYMQNAHQKPDNSYAQIVSNVNKDINPYTANVPQLPQTVIQQEKPVEDTHKEIRIVSKIASTSNDAVKKPLLSLAQYGSDSEEESDNEEEVREVYKVPTGEIQIIIDKMAAYVSKNGEQFEEIVKAKGDPRFEFLNDEHEFNKYYRNKIKELKTDGNDKAANKEEEEKPKPKSPIKPKEEKKKVIAPVSFSIKKPKEEAPKEIKSALPMEESDEEDVEVAAAQTLLASTSTQSNGKLPETPPQPVDVKTDSETTEKEAEAKNGILDVDDPILEMIDLTYEVEEKKDAKRAEDKIKDKLAAAAREKLALVTRDKALQLERKKKAAAFLKLKSAQTLPVPEKSSGTSSNNSSRRNSVEIVDVEIRSKEKSSSRERSVSKDTKSEKSRYSSSREFRKSSSRDRRSEERGSKRKSQDKEDRYRKSEDRERHRKSEDRERHRKSEDRERHRKSEDREKRKSADRDRKSEDRVKKSSSDKDARKSSERSEDRKSSEKTRKSEEKDKGKKDKSRSSRSRERHKRGRSPKRELEAITEEGEVSDSDEKRKKHTPKKKKSHKRKHSKSKHRSRSRKKSRRHNRRSSSNSSCSSDS